MLFKHYILKRTIEDVFILPFIIIGKIIALLSPLKRQYDVFFFFPFYHTGGAEKVHAQIATVIGNKNCVIYFTRKSTDKRFLADFENIGCTIKNISSITDNKWLYFLNLIERGVIATYINQQFIQAVVFNGQCNFGYKISPWIKKDIRQIELIHSFNSFSFIRIPFLPFITQTVMISKLRIENHLQQYQQIKVPEQYNQRIQYISNAIDTNNHLPVKDFNRKLTVLYAGRGTTEKRIDIIASIAKQCADKDLPITFQFLGDVEEAIPENFRQFCVCLGNYSDQQLINQVYELAHIVILTSSTEGFPLTIIEGMANGCAIMATPVGDIPYQVHENNGFVFSSITDIDLIEAEAISFLEKINSDRQLLQKISIHNYQYAKENFNIEVFAEKYKALLYKV